MNNHSNTITFIFNLALTLHTVRETKISSFFLAFVVLKLLHITASRRSSKAHRMGKKKSFPQLLHKVLLYASAKIINNMQCDNAEKRDGMREEKLSHKMGTQTTINKKKLARRTSSWKFLLFPFQVLLRILLRLCFDIVNEVLRWSCVFALVFKS